MVLLDEMMAGPALEKVQDKFIEAINMENTASSRVWREEKIDKSLLIELPLLTLTPRMINKFQRIQNKILKLIEN